ncbi:MAG: ABC transporter substrate-binding protein [Mesorhizobium sp.]|nr:ABC transporter substrate-binding protein [Mesorhizobium sp.]MCO5164129.1 ABC transporter substrate-binding protein [Mesorhizobium sp.]
MTMMTMTRRTALALLAATALVPAAYAQDKVLKIGSILALSGPNASIGKESHDGAQYAVRKLNEAGGVEIGGEKYKVELINVDDESKAERSVAGAEKLIGEDNVPVLLMPASSTSTLAVVPVAQKNKRVAMSFVAAAPAVTAPENTFSFRTTLTSVMNIAPSVEYLIKERGAKKIAYIGRNDDWGRSAGAVINDKSKELGSSVVVEEYFDTGSTDFYGLLTKVRASEPDAVIGAAFVEDGVSMIKQYRELQMSPSFLSIAVIWASPTFVKAAGTSMGGIYIATGPTTSSSPKLEAFKAQFKADTGGDALPYNVTAYDNVMLLVEAMKKAGSTDPEKLAETLRNFEYKGQLQTYKFDNSNQSQVQINVNEFKDGKVSVISSLMTK